MRAFKFSYFSTFVLNAPARIDTKSASLNEVYHEISFAIRPCSTAPVNKSGMDHAHNHLISKNANTNIPTTKTKTPEMIANIFFIHC